MGSQPIATVMPTYESKAPEILAPVGDLDMCRAAVHCGADAIYVGMPHFNARGRTHDFSLEELKELIEFCHSYQVKVFVACNILVFEDELATLAHRLREVILLVPDAFIVQDIGVARLIRAISPEQPIHASTQMTVTNHLAIAATEELGFTRYVLGREVSLTEMELIRKNTSRELEVFVHGALCVSYSGQCLTSEKNGGRSANRGQCAQSCRLPYSLIVDGAVRELGEKRYLVSPKDLCGVNEVQELKRIGIDSFKIEGRLKSPEYVAATVNAYRQAVDSSSSPEAGDRLHAPGIPSLDLTFSRGLFSGWLHGVDHQRLVDGRFGNHHGLELGTIAERRGERIVVNSEYTPHRGDGIVCCNFETRTEVGARVYSVTRISKQQVELGLNNDCDFQSLGAGMHVYINHSPAVLQTLTPKFRDKAQHKKLSLEISVSGSAGEPLVVHAKSSAGAQATVSSSTLLSTALTSPLTSQGVKDELGALYGTPYQLTQLSWEVVGNLFLHHKELKALRREMVQRLACASQRKQIEVLPVSSIEKWLHDKRSTTLPDKTAFAPPRLHVLLRNADQIEALTSLSDTDLGSMGTIYLDFEYGKEYQTCIQRVRELGYRVGIATTRILKPKEFGHLRYLERLKPDTVLVRNLGALHYLTHSAQSHPPYELIADFSFNVANSLTAQWVHAHGVRRICPSYDLNREQLLSLARNTPTLSYEVVVHQFMPAFHMEHCVFAAFLSKGSSYRDCGRPCEKHRVMVRDPEGRDHPLFADAECRNTMFHGEAQSAIQLMAELRDLGVANFRFEALHETVAQLRSKIELYLRVLQGTRHFSQAVLDLGLVDQYNIGAPSIGAGQLFQIRKYHDRKKPAPPRQNSLQAV